MANYCRAVAKSLRGTNVKTDNFSIFLNLRFPKHKFQVAACPWLLLFSLLLLFLLLLLLLMLLATFTTAFIDDRINPAKQNCYVVHCKDKMPKIWNKYSQKRNIGASVPISTVMCLWANYIFSRWVCLFCWRKYVDQSWEYINRSQIHECGNWLGLRPRSSQKRNK